jgi:hypothetical protein
MIEKKQMGFGVDSISKKAGWPDYYERSFEVTTFLAHLSQAGDFR